MRRPLFTLASAVSLVLCVATAVIGVVTLPKDSDWRFERKGDDPLLWLGIGRGHLTGGAQSTSALDRDPSANPTTGDGVWEFRGFFYSRFSSHGARTWNIQIDLRWLIVLTGLMPMIWFLRWRKRTPPGLCPVCGYDLRATPDRCPECGAVPAGAKA